MKTLMLSLFAVASGFALVAQTNAPDAAAAAAPKAPERSPTTITSDRGQFNLKSNIFVYTGNVHVDDPQMQLTCELLTVETPKSTNALEQFKRVTAITNVVIDFMDDDGQTNNATAERAVYTFKVSGSVTNKTVVLTGNPILTNAQGSQSGDEITYNLMDRTIYTKNGKTNIRPTGTNGPALFEPFSPPKPDSAKPKSGETSP